MLVGIDDASRERVAIKIIDKRRLDEKLQRKVRHEINALRKLSRHPNVVGMKDVIETDAHICIILEYCNRGELFEFITSQKRVGSFRVLTVT